MVSLGRLPLTCGLFFSLGHSTIVIVVNIAIAISASVYDKLDGFGEVGGVIGASVSSSFLFLVACINSYFLIGAVRHRRRAKARARAGLPPEDVQAQAGGCLVRACAPLLRAVDRPWKLYPVGLLFGLGFDTASSIALLAMSALAAKGPHGSVSGGRIVVLPFLFTAGMSLVDSLDSVLMLYAYAQPELKTGGKWRLFKSRKVVLDETPESVEEGGVVLPVEVEVEIEEEDDDHKSSKDGKAPLPQDPAAANYGSCSKAAIAQVDERDERAERMLAAKTVTISSLSISLTLLSILVALAYVSTH
jgi:high-affinity nickel-transport protein